MEFAPATREQLRLRMGLCGPSGSGKTFTALRLAMVLAGEKGKVAVIDTEHRSASKYVGVETPDGLTIQFDVLELTRHRPEDYVAAIKAARKYAVLVIDSLTHAWDGNEGALELVDQASKRFKGNSYVAWGEVTPQHKSLIEALLSARPHLIATLRSKTEYVLQADSRGKQVPTKVGTKPIQRDGMEYEFDLFADLDTEHNAAITKSRCPGLDGAVIHKPGRDLAEQLLDWLGEGVDYWQQHHAALFRALKEADLDIDDVSTWCEAHGKPRPRDMGRKLPDLIAFLTEGGATRIGDWLKKQVA